MGLFSRRPEASPPRTQSAETVKVVTSDAPWVSTVEVNATYRLQLSWDLFLNFTAKDINYKFSVKEVPLKGEWSIELFREDGDVKVCLTHGPGMSMGLFGTKVVQVISLCWVGSDGQEHCITRARSLPLSLPGRLDDGKAAGGTSFSIPADKWKEATRVSGGTFVPATHRSYRLSVLLEQAPADDDVVATGSMAEKKDGTRELAKRLTELNLKQTPHNVCLRFPRREGSPELWTTSDLLSRSSPYFVDLFSSEFAESEMRTGSTAREDETAEQVVVEKDFDDSDDETDEVLLAKRPHLVQPAPRAADIPFRQITITQTAFSTYHAVLVYLQTGFIDFLPLSSSSPPFGPASCTTLLTKALDKDPSLPSPVSPKSVYRLAHLLQLDDLQTLASNAFRSSLSPSNAAQELFSDTSLAYDDLRALVVEYCRVNWSEVKKSEGWKERTKKAKGREGTAEEKAAMFEVYEAVA